MVKYLRAANVKDGHLDLHDVMSMNFTLDEQRLFSLRPGDVLVTEGSGSLTSVGASAVWQGELNETVCFQNTLLRIRPLEGITEGRFIGWWARSAFGSGMFASLAGGANIYHLSAERVRATRLDLPPFEEQRRIADFLDSEVAKASKFAELRTRQLELIKERHGAMLDIAIEEQARELGTIPFRRYIIGVEQGSSPQCDAVPASDDEWGVLKVSCLRPGHFSVEENKRLPETESPIKTHEVQSGDLLITRANTPALVGSTAVVPDIRHRLLLSDKIFRVRVDDAVDPRYIAAIAAGSYIRALCSASSNGASQSMANIRFEDIKTWPIPGADRSAQNTLVQRLSESRESLSALEIAIKSQLDTLAERQQAVITAAVTGKIDVSTAWGTGVS